MMFAGELLTSNALIQANIPNNERINITNLLVV